MGSIVKEFTFVDATVARPEQVNANFDVIVTVINGNLDWDNLKASLANAANGILKLDTSADVPLAQIPDTLTGKDADTVDTKHYSQVAIDIAALIATHAAFASVHHTKAVSGDIDHGSIGGLGDDDHSAMYLKLSRASMGARRYLSSNQSINSGSEDKINLNAESWDIGSDFSNYKYTFPYTGYYQVNAGVSFGDVVANKYYAMFVKRNGTTIMEEHRHSSSTDYITPSKSDIVYGTAGQYLELYGKHNAGVTCYVTGVSRTTFLSVQLLCPVL